MRHFALAPETLEKIHAATRERIAAFDMKFNEEEARRIVEVWKAMGGRQPRMFEQCVLEPMRQDLELWLQSFELDERWKDAQLGVEKSAVGQRKDLALANLEAIDAVTLKDKIAPEQRKTAIEVAAIRARTTIELQEIDRRTEADTRAAERAMLAKGIFDDARQDQIRGRIRQLGQDEKDALEKSTASDVDVAQIKGATQTRRMVTDQYRGIFQSLKEQAGGVFDALVTKSQSVWSAIGNSPKTAMLTAIKDVVTSRAAALLMRLFTGTKGGMGGGGALQKLGGILGIGVVPVFGGGGGGTVPGLGGFGIPGAPGGTGGFAGPVTTVGSTAQTGSTGGSIGGLGSMAASYKGWLTNLGNIGYGLKGGDFGGEVAGSSRGVGGAKGGAMLMGGAMLAIDGLRRGGWLGAGEDTAGGALIGAKFGGPMGAADGFAAGIVRLFIKGAQEKAREKIKAAYGVDISDTGILKQIVDTAKSAFGGNLDLAIRSAQIRDLITLYGMSNGQKPTGMPGNVTALSLVQTGGSLFQQPQYNNGTALPGLAGIPSLDRIGGGTPSNAGVVVIPRQIGSKAVGSVIIQNGRVMTEGAISAMKSNAGRREMTALQLSPGTLVA